jgi:hypothetical protein
LTTPRRVVIASHSTQPSHTDEGIKTIWIT